MKWKAHKYQKFSKKHILENKAAGLFLDMGLGKTVTTLDALNILMFDTFEIHKPLIVAPKFVAENTWAKEAAKWDHLKHLKFSKILGDEKSRIKALKAKADVYIINRDNVPWLVTYYQSKFPFDMLILDELTSFKSSKSMRFKALRLIRPKVKRVVGLTGTPAPNGLIDLWAQIFLLDRGERLGKKITDFRSKFFNERRNGHIVYRYDAKKDVNVKEQIFGAISDICISMKASDYLELPGRIEHRVEIDFSPRMRREYDKFEMECVLELLSEEAEVTAANAAALMGKLRQFSNGAIYGAKDPDTNRRPYYELHDQKLEALEELVEQANGEPVLIFYSFQHDVARIKERLKAYNPITVKDDPDFQDKWNRKEIKVLLAHPASAGHGLNLQAGGNIIIWFSQDFNLEYDMQANARLDRQGQTKVVMIYRLVVADTVDEKVEESLTSKADDQESLMRATRAIVGKYADRSS